MRKHYTGECAAVRKDKAVVCVADGRLPYGSPECRTKRDRTREGTSRQVECASIIQVSVPQSVRTRR